MTTTINWFSNEANKKTNSELIKHIQTKKKKNYIDKFEKAFSKKINTKYSLLVSSGSNAIILALYSLNLKRGDEIIVSNRTWVATAHAAHVLGLKVVLIDCKLKDTIMDETKILSKITRKTRAILVTHMNGRANNMENIVKIAKKKNIVVIEDACQAMFSKYNNRYVGTVSNIGCFSLGNTKLLSTLQGGLLVTNNLRTYNKLKLIRNHGVINNFTDQWNQPGFNFKYNHYQAVMGFNELKKINLKINNCKKIYKLYEQNILLMKKIKIIKSYIENGEMPLYVQAIVDNKKKFINFMIKKGIQVRPLTPSLNFAKYLTRLNKKTFTNSDYFHNKGVYLPSGPTQKVNNIKKILASIKQYEAE